MPSHAGDAADQVIVIRVDIHGDGKGGGMPGVALDAVRLELK